MDGLEIGLKDGMPEVVAGDEANQSDVVAEQESQQQAMELLMEGDSEEVNTALEGPLVVAVGILAQNTTSLTTRSSMQQEQQISSELDIEEGEHSVINDSIEEEVESSAGIIDNETGDDKSQEDVEVSGIGSGDDAEVAAIPAMGSGLADNVTGYEPLTGLTDVQGALQFQSCLQDIQMVETITLPDGSTAYVQGGNIQAKLEGLSEQSEVVVKQEPENQTVTNIITCPDTVLTPKIGGETLQAIQLEDGTTAYLATGMFADGSVAISLDQLQNQMGITRNITLPISAPSTSIKNSTEQAKVTTTNTQIDSSVSSQILNETGQKSFKCLYEGCGRLYTTHHHLKVHERSHTGDRPFKCVFMGCGKAFATGYGLKSHVRVHTGEKPYKCPEPVCPKAFKTSGDLQKHIRTHTGERPFKCPFEGCERSFTTSNIRKVHIRTHTGERPYICTEEGCGKAFASATNYKNHIRIHTGEKPYVCTVQGCGKRFTEYSSLYKHHVVHTHSKPYQCNHCGKTYRQTSTLAMHKRTAHGEEEVILDTEGTLIFTGTEPGEVLDGNEIDNGTQGVHIMTPITHHHTDPEQTLVINASDLPISTAAGGMLTTHTGEGVEVGQALGTQIVHQLHGVQPLTMSAGELGSTHQIYVVTDPSQLEAIQNLTQVQLTNDGMEIVSAADIGDATIAQSLDNEECDDQSQTPQLDALDAE